MEIRADKTKNIRPCLIWRHKQCPNFNKSMEIWNNKFKVDNKYLALSDSTLCTSPYLTCQWKYGPTNLKLTKNIRPCLIRPYVQRPSLTDRWIFHTCCLSASNCINRQKVHVCVSIVQPDNVIKNKIIENDCKFYRVALWSSGYDRRLTCWGLGFEFRHHILDWCHDFALNNIRPT